MQNKKGINLLTSYYVSIICLIGLIGLGGCTQESKSSGEVTVSSGQGTKEVNGNI